jgi:hypothetical protein
MRVLDLDGREFGGQGRHRQLNADGDGLAHDVGSRASGEVAPMLDQWETLRSRLTGLGTPQRRYSLLLAVLWPVVVLIIAVLALRHVTSAKDVADLISATASLLWRIIAFTVIS